MDHQPNEKNSAKAKVQSISQSTDVLNTSEEVQEYNDLIESSEKTTPATCRASIDGN